MRLVITVSAALLLVFATHTAKADFVVSSAILEFNKDSSTNQDIELISRSKDNDYVMTEVSEIINPGKPDEHREAIDDPAKGGLLVTPEKTILSGGSRKVLRFVLLKELDDKEHIYRVTVKPVIKGTENDKSKVGLKILVGYEILVIVRPATINPNYTATRSNQSLDVVNNGNSNIIFQNGQQCTAPKDCKLLNTTRVYPGQSVKIALPNNAPVSYSIWNGVETTERQFP